jgi:hypothetical protein
MTLELDKSEDELNLAIAGNSQNALAYMAKGELYLLKGEIEKSLSEYDTAI